MNIPVLVILFCFACPAAAYLDPASGSMLFSALFGVLATGYFVLKASYYKILSLAGRGRSGTGSAYGIVCYSEGSQYWSTFRPLISSLNELGHEVAYFTSDSRDPAFDFAGDRLTVKYIGQGNQAYARLNFLNADICILTTPGLDVLQIKRSKGVGRYVHVVHSVADVHTYKLFSFDYYDVILCSGQHQIDSIRQLESKRNTPSKQLLLTGCLYFDDLASKKARQPRTARSGPRRRILVAPTWGRNGLLERFGAEIITALVKHDYEIVIRPHPQSYIVEQAMLASLATEFERFQNISWDDRPDNFASLSEADIMISDISVVVFDFAFLFGKPVITVASETDWLGTESFDMDTGPYELTLLDSIGKQVQPEQISSLPKMIAEMLDSEETVAQIESIRDKLIVNFGQGGKVAAAQVLALAKAPT